MRAQSTLSETESRTEPKRKPEGGFCFFTVMQIMMAWTALQEGHINLRDLRIYFALAEMKSRRCGGEDDQRPPEFTPREIRKLVGGAGGEREAVHKLVAVGLLRHVTKTSIEFATDRSELRFEPETLDEALKVKGVGNHERRVPVPRRIVRLIAGGARRTLIATILGHLIRCMFYRKRLCQPKGCVKASWIAEVFGVSERSVHAQRHHLVTLGWLLPQETSQRTLNVHGLWTAINLAWNALPEAKARLYAPAEPVAEPHEATGDETQEQEAAQEPRAGEGAQVPATLPPPPAEPSTKLTPPQAQNPAQTVSPIINKEPLPRGSKNQKPASGGTSGVYNFQSGKTGIDSDRPTLRNIVPEDLRDPARLLELHAQAVGAGYLSSCEADRLNFFAAANHARVIGSINPPGLFARIVRSGLWAFLTQDDDDAARLLLRRALYPEDEAPAGPFQRGQPFFGMAPTRPTFAAPELSQDAQFVRHITNVLRSRGVPESSMWRLVNRERPEWTRERWDAAQAELRGEVRPVAMEAAIA